jgi:hypothetical protein
MKNYVVVAVIVAVLYVIFFKDPYPSTVEFNGYTLGSKEDNNDTVDKEFDIFSYRDNTNHHVLIFGVRNNSTFTVDDLTKQYVSNFQRQGYKFKEEGTRHLGIKGDEVIYITEAKNMEAIVMYVEKGGSPMPTSPSDGSSVFTDLEYFIF